MAIEGGTTYSLDRKNRMMEIQTDNPNIFTNARMRQLIAGMPKHDRALWPVFKTMVADNDLIPEVGLRLRAPSYLPKLNEVLMRMRQEGIRMDWAGIQLKITLTAKERGAKGRVSHSDEEYDWSIIGKTLPQMIRNGIQRHPDLYDPSIDFQDR